MGSQQLAAAAGATWAGVARSLYDKGTVEHALQGIVDTACSIVSSSDFAGVTLLDQGGYLSSPVVTDPLVLDLDRLQADLGEGPCLEAMTGPPVLLRIADMRSEHRWPRFAHEAQKLGIISMLACSLPRKGGPKAALNLHAVSPCAFDGEAMEVAAVYADHAAVALSRADQVESLRRSVATRQVIGEATGIMMERHRLDSPAGFALLVKASQRLNVKVRDIAEVIVRTGQDAGALTASDFPDKL